MGGKHSKLNNGRGVPNGVTRRVPTSTIQLPGISAVAPNMPYFRRTRSNIGNPTSEEIKKRMVQLYTRDDPEKYPPGLRYNEQAVFTLLKSNKTFYTTYYMNALIELAGENMRRLNISTSSYDSDSGLTPKETIVDRLLHIYIIYLIFSGGNESMVGRNLYNDFSRIKSSRNKFEDWKRIILERARGARNIESVVMYLQNNDSLIVLLSTIPDDHILLWVGKIVQMGKSISTPIKNAAITYARQPFVSESIKAALDGRRLEDSNNTDDFEELNIRLLEPYAIKKRAFNRITEVNHEEENVLEEPKPIYRPSPRPSLKARLPESRLVTTRTNLNNDVFRRVNEYEKSIRLFNDCMTDSVLKSHLQQENFVRDVLPLYMRNNAVAAPSVISAYMLLLALNWNKSFLQDQENKESFYEIIEESLARYNEFGERMCEDINALTSRSGNPPKRVVNQAIDMAKMSIKNILQRYSRKEIDLKSFEPNQDTFLNLANIGELQEKLLSNLTLREGGDSSNVNAFEYVLIKVSNLKFAYRLLKLAINTPNIPHSNLFAVMQLYYSKVIEIQDKKYMEQYFKPYGYGIFEDMPNFKKEDFQELQPALLAPAQAAPLSLGQDSPSFTPVPVFPPLRRVGWPEPAQYSLPPTPNPLVPLKGPMLSKGTPFNDDEDSPSPLALAPVAVTSRPPVPKSFNPFNDEEEEDSPLPLAVAPVPAPRRSARANSDPVLLALKALRTASNSSNISKLSTAITSANAIGSKVTDTNAYTTAKRKLTQLTKQAANSARNAREFQVMRNRRSFAANDPTTLSTNGAEDDQVPFLPGATNRRETLKRMNQRKKEEARRRPPGAKGYKSLAVEPTEPPVDVPANPAPLGRNWDPFKNWVKFDGGLRTRRKDKKSSRKYRHKHVTRSTMKHGRRR